MVADTLDIIAEQKHTSAQTDLDLDPETMAINERDNLDIVKQIRGDSKWTEIEAYSYLKGNALLNNFTATVSDPKWQYH
jgi:hypothetical protein